MAIGILIAIGFGSKWTTGNMVIFEWSLIIASILGLTPIAIQAYQALRVKVVSIDVLVTIAVLGAFLIRNFEESAIVVFLFLFGAYLEQEYNLNSIIGSGILAILCIIIFKTNIKGIVKSNQILIPILILIIIFIRNS